MFIINKRRPKPIRPVSLHLDGDKKTVVVEISWDDWKMHYLGQDCTISMKTQPKNLE